MPRCLPLIAIVALAVVMLAAVPLGGGTTAAVSAPSRDLRFGIADGYRNAGSKEIGIGWQRVTLPWDQIQPNGPDDFRADFAFPPDVLQRDPHQIGRLPPSLSLSLPEDVQPGQSAEVVVQTGPDAAPGIHFVTLQLEGGGMTRSADLVVQVE